MFIIYGSSPKVAVVGQVPIQCPRCGVVAPHALLRRWSVAHIYWFPLFSHGVQHLLACPACQAAHPFSPPPGVASPIPFLHRFGCATLLLLPLLALAAMVVVAAIMRPTDRSSNTAARFAFWDFERELVSGRVYGNSEEASDVGDSIRSLLRLRADRSLAPERAAIAVRVDPGSPKRVVILVQLDQLRHGSDSWRREFLDEVKALLQGRLAPEDVVIIGLKGTTFYGATGTGPAGAQWMVQVGSSVSTRLLEDAFAPWPNGPKDPLPRPCVLQKGPSDCGPAALETVATFLGRKLTPESRDLMATKGAGTSLLDLKLAAQSVGFEAKAVKPEAGADPWDVLTRVQTPAIAHLELSNGSGHFLVVYEVKATSVQVADPARGLRVVSKDEFLAQWTGALLLVSARGQGDAEGDNRPRQGDSK